MYNFRIRISDGTTPDLFFSHMSEPKLRQWMEAHPRRVDATDSHGDTPLIVAARNFNVRLVLWMMERGANVNVTDESGHTPLHLADSVEIIDALLDAEADPIAVDSFGVTPLTDKCYLTHDVLIPRLLQDSRVQASINLQNPQGWTALHFACNPVREPKVDTITRLLKADADLTVKTPLMLHPNAYPSHPTTAAVLQQVSDADKASFLVRTRRLIMATTSNTLMPPSFVQDRLARGQPLPGVVLAAEAGGEDDEQKGREFKTTLAFLVGMEGGPVAGGVMPRDVFRVALDMLMPSWDPLKHKAVGAEEPGAEP
jgi:hypothetical protein